MSKSWLSDRDEAERILSRYGRHVVPSLPAMIHHWLTTSPDVPDATQKAFDVACDIHSLANGVRDPTTNVVAYFPMGKDIVLADALIDIATDTVLAHDEPSDALLRLNVATERLNALMKHEGGARAMATPVVHGEVSVAQIAVPFALGSEIPLRLQDAVEVLKHIENEEYEEYSTATKLAGAFGGQCAHLFPLRLGTPCTLAVDDLKQRLETMCTNTPSLLYRALAAMKLLGEDLHHDSIALQYARHVEREFERGVSLKGVLHG